MSSATGPSRSRVVTVCVLTAGLVLGPVAWAAADPDYPSQADVDSARSRVTSAATRVAELERQYAAASTRLESVRQEAAAAAEAANGAAVALDEATRTAQAAQRRAAAAQRAADATALRVREYAALAYQQNGSLATLGAYLESDGAQDLLDRAAAIEAIGERRQLDLQAAAQASGTADSMRRLAAEAQAQREAAAIRAERAREAAQRQADRADQEARTVKAEQGRMVSELARLRSSSVALERRRQEGLRAEAAARAAAAAAAQAAREARARAAAAEAEAERRRAEEEAERAEEAARKAEEEADRAREEGRPPAPAPAPKPAPAPGPSQSGVEAVLAYARAQLGKPYQWGGEGPNSFDCSGLTMMAWRQAGVYLTHYTGSQYRETRRVPISDLRPGDLVFFGDSGETSHHMGMYVGNGQMIEAPYTGAVVRYNTIYRADLVPYGGRP